MDIGGLVEIHILPYLLKRQVIITTVFESTAPLSENGRNVRHFQLVVAMFSIRYLLTPNSYNLKASKWLSSGQGEQ